MVLGMTCFKAEVVFMCYFYYEMHFTLLYYWNEVLHPMEQKKKTLEAFIKFYFFKLQ